MKIRKQVYDLTLTDLTEFPVWEFALDEEGEKGQDEATVRPCEVSGPLDPSDGIFIVRAAFTLADGTKMHGCLTTPFQGDNCLGTLQPVIITERGPVMFWYGMCAPNAECLEQNYRRLGRGADRVFPVEVIPNIELIGEHVLATIPGFVVLENFETGKTVTVT